MFGEEERSSVFHVKHRCNDERGTLHVSRETYLKEKDRLHEEEPVFGLSAANESEIRAQRHFAGL